MTLRARIVAIVSSEEQATDDRSSLPLQVDRSRAEIERRGWVEVAPPIQVWQSRDFYSLDALRVASPEYNELCIQAEHGELDVVVGRDHSRVLGRTEALQSALRNYLGLCRVQLYFYSSPVEPLSPDMLGRRGRAQIGARYLDAIAGVRDEEEVARLLQRREDGMNKHATAGRWRHSSWPLGYKREVLATIDGKRILGPLEVDPETAPLAHKIFELYRDGYSARDCHAYKCEALGIPQETMGHATILAILINPAYVGVMLWGRSRADAVAMDGKVVKRRLDHLTADRQVELVEEWLQGRDARTEEEVAAKVVIAWGEWEPLIERDLWLAVQAERRRRQGNSSYIGLKDPSRREVYPLSGLLHCSCGGTYSVGSYDYRFRDRKERAYRTPRYSCHYRYRTGLTNPELHCPSRNAVDLQRELFAVLGGYFTNQGLLEEAIQANIQTTESAQREAEIKHLEAQITRAEQSIKRWDHAFEIGALTVEEWQEKIAPHKEQRQRAALKIKRMGAYQEAKKADPAQRLTHLRGLLAKLAELSPDHDPAEVKRFLRQLIRKIVLHEGKIQQIEFN